MMVAWRDEAEAGGVGEGLHTSSSWTWLFPHTNVMGFVLSAPASDSAPGLVGDDGLSSRRSALSRGSQPCRLTPPPHTHTQIHKHTQTHTHKYPLSRDA